MDIMLNLIILFFLIALQGCASLFQSKNGIFLDLSKAAAIPVIEEIGDFEIDFDADSILVQKWTTVEKVKHAVGNKLYEKIAPTTVASFENQRVYTGLTLQRYQSDSLYFYYFRFKKKDL